MAGRHLFTGHIAGAGTTGGTRLVLGAWSRTPHGQFADVMVERPDGHRILLAPDSWVAEFVSATYSFDEVQLVPVELTRTGIGPGAIWTVEAGPLRWTFTVGDRQGWGHLLRSVPPALGSTLTMARVTNLVAPLIMPGVQTLGSAGNDRLEWYSPTDLHHLSSSTATWDGQDLGRLADMTPPPQFGFSSTPRTPSLTALTTTVLTR